jgi:uncharacterized membrane protein YhhN
MTLIFAGISAGAALAHLVSLYCGPPLFRSISKTCLIPPLLALYLVTAKSCLPAAILGCAFGWLGDILLIGYTQRIIFFKLGLASFLLGHLAYIAAFLTFFPGGEGFAAALSLPALGISLLAALALGPPIFRLIRPGRPMRIPVIVYGAVLELMILCALQLALYRRDPPALIIFAGSLLFFFSDTLLAYSTFRTRPRAGHFLIMSSYIAAQGCIIGGLSAI